MWPGNRNILTQTFTSLVDNCVLPDNSSLMANSDVTRVLLAVFACNAVEIQQQCNKRAWHTSHAQVRGWTRHGSRTWYAFSTELPSQRKHAAWRHAWKRSACLVKADFAKTTNTKHGPATSQKEMGTSNFQHKPWISLLPHRHFWPWSGWPAVCQVSCRKPIHTDSNKSLYIFEPLTFPYVSISVYIHFHSLRVAAGSSLIEIENLLHFIGLMSNCIGHNRD